MLFQYETIIDLNDLKSVSYTCPECQTVTTFSIDASSDSRKYAPGKCAGCGYDLKALLYFVHEFGKCREAAISSGIRLRAGAVDQKPKPAAD
jgi:predicted RNA-binding Zn-ribbon protein involved in translation (DUF1610 family)